MAINPYINTTDGALGSTDLRTAKNAGFSQQQVGVSSSTSVGGATQTRSQVIKAGPIKSAKTPTVTTSSGSSTTLGNYKGESGKSGGVDANGNAGGSTGGTGTPGFDAIGAFRGGTTGAAFGPVGAFLGFFAGGVLGGWDTSVADMDTGRMSSTGVETSSTSTKSGKAMGNQPGGGFDKDATGKASKGFSGSDAGRGPNGGTPGDKDGTTGGGHDTGAGGNSGASSAGGKGHDKDDGATGGIR